MSSRAPAPFRPAAVKTFGILNIVFAGLGVLGLIMMYVMYFSGINLGPRNAMVEAAHESPGYMSYLRVTLVTGAAGIIALGLAGIGLLRMKMWGRKLSLAYAVYAGATAVAGLVATQHYLADSLSSSSDPAAKAGLAGGFVGAAIGLAYPVLLLIFMNKRHIRVAFERAAEPPIPPARMKI